MAARHSDSGSPGGFGFTQSIYDIAQWARTPHQRACAGARKVRIDLGLAGQVPPVRQDAVATVGEAVGDNVFGVPDRTVARHLMTLADDVPVGPGTPHLTVAAAAVYAALNLCGDTSTARRYLM